jgi:prophage regulatory protein
MEFNMSNEAYPSARILRLKQVEKRTGLKKSTIYKRIALGTFPKQILLGGGRAIGWLESEINDYIVQWHELSREMGLPCSAE